MDGARITQVGLGNQLFPRTPYRRTSKNFPPTHSGNRGNGEGWVIEKPTSNSRREQELLREGSRPTPPIP